MWIFSMLWGKRNHGNKTTCQTETYKNLSGLTVNEHNCSISRFKWQFPFF